MSIAAVTAVFDIGRAGADGRTIDHYLSWLNGTLRLPIPFTVFLDSSLDQGAVQLKPGDNLVRMSWDELAPSRWEPVVVDICGRREALKAPDDLTFRLPRYALVQFSKFDWIERAAQNKSGVLLWIDAGISRFLTYEPGRAKMNARAAKRLMGAQSVAVNVTPAFAQQRSASPRSYVTSCTRLVSGEMFAIKAERAREVKEAVYQYVEREWLANGLWDNEQVAMGEMLLSGVLPATILDRSGTQAQFARRLFPRPLFAW